jgi:hypothetical protein
MSLNESGRKFANNLNHKSFKPLSLKKGVSVNHISLVQTSPVLLSHLPVCFVRVVKLGELEILITHMFFPFHGDFSSSPKPNSVYVVISLNSVNSQNAETIFSKVINVPQIPIFQIRSQISNFSFALVSDVV